MRVWNLDNFEDVDREAVLNTLSGSVVTTSGNGGYVRLVTTEVEPVALSAPVAPYVATIRYCLEASEPAEALCAMEDMFGSLELEQGISDALTAQELEQLFRLAGEAV